MRQLFSSALLAACCFLTSPLTAQNTNEFDVFIGGLKTGRLSLKMQAKANMYSASVFLRTIGLVSAIAPYRFEAAVHGSILKNHHRPRHYSEKSDTGKRQTNKIISYVNGVPKVTQSKSREPHWLVPETQKDRIDTVTATYQLLRDRSASELCQQHLKLFDGDRAVDITLFGKTTDDTDVICQGLYQRIGGFSKKQMSKGIDFPFTLRYRLTGDDNYQAHNLSVKTLRGRAKFRRR